jgi:GNAT superfamily N-acetyltransferase
MGTQIRPLDPQDDDHLEASYLVEAAAVRHDVPDFPPVTRRVHRNRYEYPWPGQEDHVWLAELDGQVVGQVVVNLPMRENLEVANVQPTVHPAFRRRGVGRALYEQAITFVRGIGRKRMIGDYVANVEGLAERDPGHAAFAKAVGAKAALPEVRRRLYLDNVDRSSWDKLLDDAREHAQGYSVLRWIGAPADDIVEDIAALDSRLLLDAPTGDLDIEPERVDVARIRENDAMVAGRGRRMYHSAVRHDSSGRVVAWTTLGMDADETTHAWQQITIVDPAHRGHRLGVLIKVENLQYLLAHESAVREIDTWNAAENAHMIAINEVLGFRPVDGWVSWQQEV